jgi:hypothetical protein
MKIFYLTLLFGIMGNSANHTSSDDIIGVWKLENGIDLEIYKSGPYYLGKIHALNGFNKGQIIDIHNPDQESTKDSLVGKNMITNLKYNSKKNNWENGTMYAPHLGIFANLEIKNCTTDTLTAVGSKFMFWRTEYWIRQ